MQDKGVIGYVNANGLLVPIRGLSNGALAIVLQTPTGQSVSTFDLDEGDIAPNSGTGLAVVNFGYGFNGADWENVLTASAANLSLAASSGATLIAQPGHWSINHTPAANTQATITRAGTGANRHVCTSITATLIGLAAAAEATVLVNLRDDVSGAGTILWSTRLLVTGTSGSETGITLSNLSILGSAGNAMTLEFAAAGGANTFSSVALTGFDVN